MTKHNVTSSRYSSKKEPRDIFQKKDIHEIVIDERGDPDKFIY